MVTIDNEEMITELNIQEFQKNAESIMEWMGYKEFDLGILLTNDQAIQAYNRDFRKKDVPTDILSFPFHTELKAGETIEPLTEDDKSLGDLIISLEYIKPLCIEENKTINEHLRTLLCHGICHLLGYDHYSEETDKLMQEKERWLASKFAEV